MTMKIRTPAQRRKRKKKDSEPEVSATTPLTREEELRIKAEVYDFKEV